MVNYHTELKLYKFMLKTLPVQGSQKIENAMLSPAVYETILEKHVHKIFLHVISL